MSTPSSRFPFLESEVRAVIQNLSGRELSGADAQATFFDLGFDSLLLTQASQALRQKFGVKLTFRQLMENLVTIAAVAGYFDEQLPPDKFTGAAPVAGKPAAPEAVQPASGSKRTGTSSTAIAARNETSGDLIDRVVKQQLVLMNQQLDLLRASGHEIDPAQFAPGVAIKPTFAAPATASVPGGSSTFAVPDRSKPISDQPSRYFGPYKPLDRSPSGALTPRQQEHLDKLIAAYVARTPRSKAYTQKHRKHFADPRTISGFRQQWKEMVYPIVVKHSQGSRFRDLDGNEYLDVVMGFGTNLFGHSPDFLTRAISNQLGHGVEVGPQSPIAGKVAELLCEFSGQERAAFSSSGSESVLAAIRLARTVTGRTRIATTSGYHGINDEVLVRASVVDGIRRPAPIAPGIPQHAVDQVLVLDYGSPESLELLRAHAHELAAVLIEPVQARRPDLQPVDFLREVRKITTESGTALVFDELITGFRAHPGGAQVLFGIEADIVTYGKIIGGGLPIGAICGKAVYLDALDGGMWQYGDDSSPETGMTFFAGTYVRHPLAIRAALSVLTALKREGPALQDQLSARTGRFAHELNGWFEREEIPMRVTWFRSMMYFVFQQEFKYASLLFFHLRLKGLHIWEGRPIFFSTAHTDEEIDFIIELFKESIQELRTAEFIPVKDVAAARIGSTLVPGLAPLPPGTPTRSTTPMEFSLYFFGNYDAAYREDKYALLQDAAKFADANGFTAAWLPERHFHAVGGFSPNSSLLACSLAAVTKNLQLRGGSVVLPLHHPVRVAEEWSVADNLSQGRVAISIATGWHPNDFVFAPEAFADRRGICARNLDIVQRLWRGETVEMSTPHGDLLPVKLYPLPRQKELKVWATCIHLDSYADAGRRGLNVLGYLMNQTVDELAEKIAAYREGRRAAGLDPAEGHVTTLLFTYLDETVERAREVARAPLCGYLRSYLDNSQKKIEKEIGAMDVDQEDIEYLTNRSCDDYFNGKSLIGTVESCAAVVARLKEIGVDEIGCFIDFGVAPELVRPSLQRVTKLMHEPVRAQIELPLPQAEQGLWLLCSMNEDAARAYRESTTLVLNGELERESLQRAAQELVNRHGALRTTVNPDGRAQTLHACQDFKIDYIDFSGLPEDQARPAAEDALERLENENFAGMRGPFLHGCLLKIAPRRHLLTFFFHHVVGNGPSYWVFLDELASLYRSYTTGDDDAALLPAFPFEEFVAKRVSYETSPEKGKAEAFWIDQMQGGVPALDLPFDHPLPPELTYIGSREEIVLEAELVAALKQIGAARHCSLFMVLLSAYNVLLHRLSGQDDLIVGVPFDSPIRSESSDRSLFANTTNMLPLRSHLRNDDAFPFFLARTKELVLAASEHQDYFFGNLVAKLNLPRHPARSPLFNVVFNLETGDFHRTCGELEMTLETRRVPYRGPRNAAMFDLYLNAAERPEGKILIQCDHNLKLIEPDTMRRWLGHYAALLRGIVAMPSRAVLDLPLTEEDPAPAIVP
jgi:natural product biosynthesis luciferase-like monooxygenase protein